MNGRIPEEIIQQVKDRISIREVVSDYVTLKRTGASYKGLCPFHKEKTPSFNVHEGMQVFRCFGCGISGNAFGFLMKMEGLSFPEAVRKLAGRVGVIIPETEPTPEELKTQESRGRLFRVNELAEGFFQHQLLAAPAGRGGLDYLVGRGLSREVIERFRLGFAPESWDSLLNYLKGQGVPESLAHEAGLVIAKDSGGYYDRFRQRVIFPIRDVSGRVRGFGGRIIGEGEPKYLNSPETALFKKGQGFYGLDLAKDAIRRQDRVAVVEGYLDLIALVQQGISYTVATLGTALTADHASLVRRYTQNVFLVFDADEPGIKASLRALEVFLEEGLSPRIALMPEGQDPDDFVRAAGPEAFLARVEAAPNLVDFFMDRELKSAGTAPAKVAQAVKAIGPMLARIRDPIERGLYAQRLAEKAGVPEKNVRDRMFVGARAEGVAAAAASTEEAFSASERNLLYLLLHHPQVAATVEAKGGIQDLVSPELKEFCRTTLDQIKTKGQADPAVLLHRFSGSPLPDLVSDLILNPRGESADQVERSVRDTLHGLRLQRIRDEKRLINREIQAADPRDLGRFHDLQLKKQELERQERAMAGPKGEGAD